LPCSNDGLRIGCWLGMLRFVGQKQQRNLQQCRGVLLMTHSKATLLLRYCRVALLVSLPVSCPSPPLGEFPTQFPNRQKYTAKHCFYTGKIFPWIYFVQGPRKSVCPPKTVPRTSTSLPKYVLGSFTMILRLQMTQLMVLGPMYSSPIPCSYSGEHQKCASSSRDVQIVSTVLICPHMKFS
jgi:hypothetical protein